MSEAIRDQNFVTAALGQSSTSSTTTLPFKIDSSTGRLLVDLAGGSGTVTDVSVVSANGFAGTVATSTSTPAITLSTTVTGILKGNGTAISAVVSGTDLKTVGGVSLIGAGDAGTIGVGYGGTGKTSISALSVWVANSANTLVEVTPGAGNSIRINGAGNAWEAFTPSASVPTTITVADEATDTTCFVSFFTAATGDLGPKTNTNLTFNSNTGVLTSASSVLTTTDINGGTIDGTSIGASSASTIIGTTITANTGFMPDADDGAYLGQSGTAFSDLFLASGGVINWNAGNATLTHSASLLTSNVPFSVGTSNAITVGSIELGAASDTTITRTGAGVAAIEGVQILTVAGGTLTGSITLGENTGIALDPAGSADGKWSGMTITGVAGETIATGDLVYLKAADSRWWLTDADAAATGGPVMVAMCVVGGNAAATVTLLTQGQIRADAKFPALTIGAPVYLGETAGAIQVAIPTGADNVIKVVGWALTADEIYFNPSPEWQITVA